MGWFKKKPELDSGKVKEIQLEVSRRLNEEWKTGVGISVDDLDGVPCMVIGFQTESAGYELLLGQAYSVLNRVTLKDPARSGWTPEDTKNNPAEVEEVARYADITKNSVLT